VLAPAIDGSGEATARRQVLGAYALWDALRAAHPNLEIEACAAGGGRIDVGFAARAHRFWTSDNIDAASRSAIQRGFLQFMPPEVMGAHVGASPAHATGRRQTLGFRALVAMPGHFGVELDPRRLTSDERTRLSEWTELYKRHRDRFHSGRTWLGEGEDGLVWQAHGEPGDLLLLASREAPGRLAREAPLRLPLLRGSGVQRVRLLAASPAKVDPSWQTPLAQAMAEPHGAMLEGDWLASVGLPLPSLRGQGAVLFAIGNP
jgi:alpha-galactosidase